MNCSINIGAILGIQSAMKYFILYIKGRDGSTAHRARGTSGYMLAGIDNMLPRILMAAGVMQ